MKTFKQLIKRAAKTAKGREYLYANGKRCLWGQAAHLVGVDDNMIYYTEHFGSSRALPGMEPWDNGEKKLAVELASSRFKTIGAFENYLKRLGFLT